jgi:cytochrome c peroxidase
LGPTADQALNPFTSGGGEQNIREKNVCQRVKTAHYKDLYNLAFGKAIDCSGDPQNPEGQSYDTAFKRIALAVAAWQASTDVNSFSSKRDKALACDQDGQFPLTASAIKCPDKTAAELARLTFTAQENLGHDLFYNRNDSGLNNGGNNGSRKNARCTTCHVGVPEGEFADPTGVAPHQLYTDNRYHNIGVPFNRQIPRALENPQTGLNAHVSFNNATNPNPNVLDGEFKTPTLRNVAKGVSSGFVKAYAHNGYFKSLNSIVHFYNTRDVLQRCEDLNIFGATEAEALAHNCWPKPEFANTGVAAGGAIIGNLGLTETEEDALVAYLKTFSDEYTPTNP